MFSLFFLLSLYLQAAEFDFYPPKAKLSAPIIVFIHGGAWISGSKEQYKFVGEMLAKEGYCAVVVDYSLAPKAKHPVPVDQLNDAITELEPKKQNACNKKRIFLVGHSAGAHMIAFWNTKYTNKVIKGLVGLEGIYDLVELSKKWPDYKEWFLNSAFGDSSKWAAASPALLKPKSETPWLLFHSLKDELVDTAQTENFKSKLIDQKIPVASVTLKTENHFGAIEAALKSAELKKFINEH